MGSNIDILTKYKNLKSPAIPTCLKVCGEELLNRVKAGQFRVLPSCWSSLLISATELRQNNLTDLQNFLDEFGSDNKFISGLTENYRNLSECIGLPTQKIFAAFWEFLTRCQQSLNVQISYPSYGWVILGPPYLNPFDSFDEAQFAKEVNALLETILEQGLVKRDILCYVMRVFAELVQSATEYCRDKPALACIIRYQIANQFGPILFTVTCERCKAPLSDKNRSCEYCITVAGLLQKPFAADLVDRLLRHFSTEFWDKALTVTQRTGSFVPSDPEKTHADITGLFYKKKATVKAKSVPPFPTPNLQKNRGLSAPAANIPVPTGTPPQTANKETTTQRTSYAANAPAPPVAEQSSKDQRPEERQSTPTVNTFTTSTETSSVENPWGLSTLKRPAIKKQKNKASRRSTTGSKGTQGRRRTTTTAGNHKQRSTIKSVSSRRATNSRKRTGSKGR
ncbi:unnamed protein product [Echinostoma caproni]|uniref:DUF5726 domain-containing protein n=1 Tax=Echinostoma caproni TaxID=27848 RepID=A0A183B598_9TREM|nr:unnamed protein product [Echinostoma caproni]